VNPFHPWASFRVLFALLLVGVLTWVVGLVVALNS
jgi:hypothetical protein